MEWQSIGSITTSSNYTFTPVVNGSLFKLKHTTESLERSNLKIAIRQAFDDDGSLALFDYKLINCKTEQDIILFNLPQGLTGRRLAFKRVDDLIDDWTIEIQTLVNNGVNNMPSYSSLPVSNSTTKRIVQTIVGAYGTPLVNLSPTNPNKVGTTVTNISEFNLYISLGVEASLTVYDKILGTGEVFETPFNWCGDIFGFCDSPIPGDQESVAKVQNFFGS